MLAGKRMAGGNVKGLMDVSIEDSLNKTTSRIF